MEGGRRPEEGRKEARELTVSSFSLLLEAKETFNSPRSQWRDENRQESRERERISHIRRLLCSASSCRATRPSGLGPRPPPFLLLPAQAHSLEAQGERKERNGRVENGRRNNEKKREDCRRGGEVVREVVG